MFPVPNGDTVTNMALNFQARIDQNVQMMKATDRVQVSRSTCHRIATDARLQKRRKMRIMCHTLRRQGAGAAEIATLYYSREGDVARAEIPADAIRAAFPALHIEIHAGGQPGGSMIIIIALE